MKVEGLELVGSLGYTVAGRDWTFNDKKIDPFGVLVGLDFGYTFPFGLRLGTDLVCGFGRMIESTNWKGGVSTTETSSFAWGASVGYDLVLSSSLRLRGAADAGLLVFFYKDEGEAAVGVYVGPKVALIWQCAPSNLGFKVGGLCFTRVPFRWGSWAAHGSE